MAADVAETLSELARLVEEAGPDHAPGLAPCQATVQEAIEQSEGHTKELWITLLETLQAFILAEEDETKEAYEELLACIGEMQNQLGLARAAEAKAAASKPASLATREPLAPMPSEVESPARASDAQPAPGVEASPLAPSPLLHPSPAPETTPPPTRAAAAPEPAPAGTPPPRAEDSPAPPLATPAPALHQPDPPAAPPPSAAPSAEPLSDWVDENLMRDFAVEGTEQLSECNEHLLSLEKNPDNRAALDAIFRCFHTIKGVAGFMGMDQLQSVAHAAEDLLDLARAGNLTLAGATMDTIFDAADVLGQIIGRLPDSLRQRPWKAPESDKGAPLVARIRTILRENVEPASSQPLPLARLHERVPPSPSRRSASARDASESAPASASQKQDSIRVDAERLDHLVDMIGELVINESMLTRALQLGDTRETQRQLVRMAKVTREVQEVGGSLRMVPVRACFGKMARLARDVAKKSKKRVNFVLTGEETELDKTVVDRIADPLVHLVRNAIDHGLEATAQDREKLGKSPTGNVHLRAFHKGGTIHIELEDDGRGLNRERIIAVAIERGLIQNADGMSDREIFRLVCEPGFSTKKEVTSLSGRGVGMDVVKRQIEHMGGSLEITSSPNRGSCFSMRVPLTLAVIDGMVIRLGEGRYVIPTLNIVRLVEPEEARLCTIAGKGELLIVANEPVPVLRLEHIFHLPPSTADRRLAVITEADGTSVAILIDELLGQQQAVIKNLGQGLGDVPGVSGCAIMPDGRVGLVLDVAGVLTLARTEPAHSDQTVPKTTNRIKPAEEQWMSQ